MIIDLLDQEIDDLQNENSVHRETVYIPVDTDILDYPISEDVEVIPIARIAEIYELDEKSKIQIGEDITGKKGKVLFYVYVGGQEGTIPHLHIFRNRNDLKAWKNGICLMLHKNSYFDHSKNKDHFKNEDEFKLVLDMLNDRCDVDGYTSMNNWRYALRMWNDINERYPIDLNTKMPNYDFASIKTYKESKKG